jgi:hypothetical protein
VDSSNEVLLSDMVKSFHDDETSLTAMIRKKQHASHQLGRTNLRSQFENQAKCAGYDSGCWLFDPCCGGMSCHPLIQKCYSSPRKLGEPCMLGFGCGAGLACAPFVQKCYHSPGQWGEPCSLGFDCGVGLSCQPLLQTCYHSPRIIGEPCSIGFDCAFDLFCRPIVQQCATLPTRYETCDVIFGCRSGFACDLSTFSVGAGVFEPSCIVSPTASPILGAPVKISLPNYFSKKVSDLRFVFAHDAMTAYLRSRLTALSAVSPQIMKVLTLTFGVLTASVSDVINAVTITQPDGNVQNLLNCGTRALDLRVQINYCRQHDRWVDVPGANLLPQAKITFQHGPIPIPISFEQMIADARQWSDVNKADDGNLVLLITSHCVGPFDTDLLKYFGTFNCTKEVGPAFDESGIPYVTASQLAKMTYLSALQLARSKGGILLGVSDDGVVSNWQSELKCRTGTTSNCFNSDTPLNNLKNYLKGTYKSFD